MAQVKNMTTLLTQVTVSHLRTRFRYCCDRKAIRRIANRVRDRPVTRNNRYYLLALRLAGSRSMWYRVDANIVEFATTRATRKRQSGEKSH